MCIGEREWKTPEYPEQILDKHVSKNLKKGKEAYESVQAFGCA